MTFHHGRLAIALVLTLLLAARGVDAQPAGAVADAEATSSEMAEWQLVRVEGDHESPAADEITELLAPYRAQTAALTEPIATCTATMSNRAPARELGAWMADVMRSAASEKLGEPVDVAIVNRGGIRAPVAEGPVSRATMMQVMPFDNEVVIFRMNGAQLLEVAEFLATRRGYYLYSGMRMAIDREERELRAIEVGGEPIDPARSYIFAATDYVAGGGDNTRFPEEVFPYQELGLLHRDALIAETERLGAAGEPISPPADYYRMYYGDELPPPGFIPTEDDDNSDWQSDSPRPEGRRGDRSGGEGGQHGPDDLNANTPASAGAANTANGGGDDQ